MISTDIVQVLDLVDADDPILAREGFFECIELGAFGGETRATDAILGLAGREETVVVVIRHFVPGMERNESAVEYIKRNFAEWLYIKLFLIVGVASSSILYSPLAVKNSRSWTSSGQIPSAILTIHRNLLISSPEYPKRAPKTTST